MKEPTLQIHAPVEMEDVVSIQTLQLASATLILPIMQDSIAKFLNALLWDQRNAILEHVLPRILATVLPLVGKEMIAVNLFANNLA